MTKCPAGILSLSESETFHNRNSNGHPSELGPNASVLAGIQYLHPVLPWLPFAHGTGLLIRFTPLRRHCPRVWNSAVLNSQHSFLCLHSPDINFTHCTSSLHPNQEAVESHNDFSHCTLHSQPNTSYSSNIKHHKINITNYTYIRYIKVHSAM